MSQLLRGIAVTLVFAVVLLGGFLFALPKLGATSLLVVFTTLAAIVAIASLAALMAMRVLFDGP